MIAVRHEHVDCEVVCCSHSLLCPQVYYITCPEITKAFTHFPTTPTGAEVTSIEQATGTCVAHAREESPPSFLCTGDGQWSLLNGGCACLPGYQADTEKQSCDGEYPLPLSASWCVPMQVCVQYQYYGDIELSCVKFLQRGTLLGGVMLTYYSITSLMGGRIQDADLYHTHLVRAAP